MEPSKIFGVSEECHSSESGWTMYIGSPTNGSSDAASDDENEEEEEDEDRKHKGYYYAANNQDDSDDSMASDASSGPSHQEQHPFRGIKNPHNEVNFCLQTKTKKPLMENKKQRDERKEVKLGQKPKTSVQTSSKVRKSIFMGKRN